MLIEIHAIQNHSPANLNRDDLGAPKTCYFGGVLRSRISSQCIKRSIRMSEEFKMLLGGVRTRQLAKQIAEKVTGRADVKRAVKILEKCGIKPKGKDDDRSDMLVYTTKEAILEMAGLLQNDNGENDDELAKTFAKCISECVAVPDMALSGRMLEPDSSSKEIWRVFDTTVEASLQVAHAISTHEARPEVDYYVAADDIPGEDAGAGYLDEAMFASACFYKYFSIHWETLVSNLKNNERLAAHTVGAFIRGAAMANPTGKQNSFAAHNPPDGMLIEIKDTPISYANAFADPVQKGQRGIISQSIAQLGQYIHDLDTGYGKPRARFWFSPNLRYPLSVIRDKKEISLAESNIESLDKLIPAVVKEIGHDWEEVRKLTLNSGGGLMSANTLFLRLEGHLQAWGDQQSKFVVRRTAEAPTKSGVIGMLCAALGVPRPEAAKGWLPKLGALRMGVRIDAPGVRWWDYHTVGAGMQMRIAEGKTKPGAMLTRREYLCDASFLVALQGEQALIDELAKAMGNPKWTLYLGRKSCPPSRPLLEHPVKDFPDLLSAITSVQYRRRLYKDKPPQTVDCLLDWEPSAEQPVAPDDALIWYDVPVTLEPPAHAPRFVIRKALSVGADREVSIAGNPAQNDTPSLQRTRADYGNTKYQKRRKERLDHDHNLCVFCKSPATTVQHVTYRHAGGNESINELRSLCRLCHDAVTMIEYGLGMGLDRINPEEKRWREKIMEKRAEIINFRSLETRRRRLAAEEVE